MSDAINRQQAKRLFLRAVELIHQTDAPLLPRYLQLFFEYAQGSNHALTKAIDELLHSHGKPSPSELDFILDLHLTDPEECNNFGGLGESVGMELRNTLDVVMEAISFNQDFSNSVEKAETQLIDFSDPKKVRLAITSLVQATRTMSQRSADVNVKLSSSVAQIEQLQKDLDQVRLDSQTDSLTGVANRKFFDQTLIKEIAEAAKYDQPLSLCMVDVDHFKKFNDKHGHRAGDAALRFVASVLQHSIRDYDLVSRYGGEEFVVIMPNADLSIGVDVSNRICETLSAKKLTKRATGESLGYITISVGVAQFREFDTPGTLVERADRALYEAKRSGRNCVKPESDEPANYSQVRQSFA